MMIETAVQTDWMTVVEAALYLRCGKDLIYQGVHAGGLKHVRIGGRKDLRFRRPWLDKWYERSAHVNEPPM